MTPSVLIRLILVAFLACAPMMVVAQASVPAEDATEPIADPDVAWERLALRAEELAERGDASEFALIRLRSELVTWRDTFMSRTSQNAGRLATIDAQIAALGPVPENGEVAEPIANRRAELEGQRRTLAAPALLAQEAHARANGLISEIDALLRENTTSAILERGPSPLNPTHLLAAIGAVWDVFRSIGAETGAVIMQRSNSGALASSIPRALLLFIAAAVLLGFGWHRITIWREELARRAGRWGPLWLLLMSLAQIIVAIIGLTALTAGLQTLNIFGARGSDIIETIPAAGFLILFSWWLSRLVFPVGPANGYLNYSPETRSAGRRYGNAIAWVLAIGALFDAALKTVEQSQGTSVAIEWPVLVILGLLLWRLGHAIKSEPVSIDEHAGSQGRMRKLIGRFCTIVAITGPLVAAFGYVAAGRMLIVPSILSLALIGTIIILQQFVQLLSQPSSRDEDNTEDPENKSPFALLPVLVSFALYMLSLPFFALIWGARTADLSELWTRFREGFAVGDTRISPTDFLTFAVVFGIGYMLTRFIQGTLRKSVMPRTRLDLGGQNAIVAGFGYVGIILAAIVAVTGAGIDLSNLALVAGALSVGIGFGLQNIVSNFVAGIILLIERPVSEGDWIEVGNQMGYVRSISVRSTRIETFDRTDVIVPNSDLVSGQVTNWTRGNLVGRVIVPVGVAYGTDTDQVTKILMGIAETHPMVLMNPPPAVLFKGFGADSLDFEIRAILRDVNYVLSVKSEMNHDIARKFAAAGIEIPFAQRDIWLRNPEALRDTADKPSNGPSLERDEDA